MRLSQTITATMPPPIMEVFGWLDALPHDPDMPVLNFSQAAPVDPPPLALREAIADFALTTTDAHLYGPVLGTPELRAAISQRFSGLYGAALAPDNVAVTAGCNQAFCAAIAAVAAPGDAVILPTPYYFNHRMHLDMMGIEARLLPTDDSFIPDAGNAAAMMDARVRAIVLVTPNNPTGAEYPPQTLRDFAELARRHNCALVIDETYRDFHTQNDPAHDLLADPDWGGCVIQLYSFSKVYRLTGHRVGALIAGPQVISEVEKYLDTVTICPNRIGQHAALYGVTHLESWVAKQRREIHARRAAVTDAFGTGMNARIVASGAYFATLEHGMPDTSLAVAQAFLSRNRALVLPGTMFAPARDAGGDGRAEKTLRIAFANAGAEGIGALAQRWREFERRSG